MRIEVLLRDLIFAGSVVVSTLLVYIAWISLKDWGTAPNRWSRMAKFEFSRALLCIGVAGIIMLVTESIIIRIPGVDVTWESVAYLASLGLASAGGLGMALNWMRTSERR